MAKKRLERERLYDPQLFDKLIADGREMLAVFTQMEEQIKAVLIVSKGVLSKNNFSSAKDLKDFKSEQAKVNALLIEYNKIQKQKAAVDAQLALVDSKLNKELVAEKINLANARKEQQAKIAADKAEIGSLDALNKRNKVLTLERQKQSLFTKEGRQRIREINAELNANNAIIKANVSELEKQRLSVGGYKDAITAALNETGFLSKEFAGLQSALGSLKGVFAGSADELKDLVKNLFASTEAIRAQQAATAALTGEQNAASVASTRLATGLRLIGKLGKTIGKIGLIALVAAAASFFAKFEEGQDMLEKFAIRAKAVFGVLVNVGGLWFQNFLNYFKILGLRFDLFIAKAQNAFTFGKGAEKTAAEVKRIEKAVADANAEYEKNEKLIGDIGQQFKDAIAGADKFFQLQEDLDKLLVNNAKRVAVLNGLYAIQESKVQDITLSFADQEKAEERLIEIAREKFKIDLQNAQKQEEIYLKQLEFQDQISAAEIKRAVDSGEAQGRVTQGILDNITKLRTATIEVQNEIDLQNLKIEEGRREREQKATINSLKILREQADTRFKINLKIAEDESLPYEERIKAANKAFEEIKKANDKEFEILDERTKKQIDVSALISETSATALEEKIRELELSKKLEPQLSEAVQRRIDLLNQQLEVQKKIADFEAERIIKQDEKSQKTYVETLNEQNKIAITKAKENTKAILEEQNRMAGEGYKANIEAVEFNFQQEYILQKKALEDEFELRVGTEKLIGDELKLAQIKLDEELRQLKNKSDEELLKAKQDLAKKELDTEKAKQKELRSLVQQTGDLILSDLDKQNQSKQDAIDRDLDRRKSALQIQEDLAARGQENELAFQEKKIAEGEAEKVRLEKERLRQQRIEAFFKAYLAYLEYYASIKQDPSQATGKALTQTTQAIAIAGAFKEGIVDLPGIGTGTSDSNLALLSKGESVITAAATREHKEALKDMNAGTYDPFNYLQYAPNVKDLGEKVVVIAAPYNDELLKEVKTLNKSIKNIKQTNVSWDSLGNMIQQTQEQGVKKTIRIFNKPRRI